jgi:tetraacyldisaccharide 4'-kinase
LNFLSALYGRGAAFRRAWYAGNPHRRRRLAQPVISVGNLVVGGSGKTPLVTAVARMLRDAGERPSILSRGYARKDSSDPVVVVSDGSKVLTTVARAGDEPFMLAKALRGVAIVVAADRYEAGAIAETQLGATVHVLDDGFQHVQLARDVDLLVVSRRDLDEDVIPTGRLREPLASARVADALLIEGTPEDQQTLKVALGVATAFQVIRRFAAVEGGPRQAIAVAGIARPERFFDALRDQGWTIAREFAFPDHHWFTAADIATVEAAARDAGIDIVTTEKDFVRLENINVGRALSGSPGERDNVRPTWTVLQMEAAIDASFAPWLAARLAAARRRA